MQTGSAPGEMETGTWPRVRAAIPYAALIAAIPSLVLSIWSISIDYKQTVLANRPWISVVPTTVEPRRPGTTRFDLWNYGNGPALNVRRAIWWTPDKPPQRIAIPEILEHIKMATDTSTTTAIFPGQRVTTSGSEYDPTLPWSSTRNYMVYGVVYDGLHSKGLYTINCWLVAPTKQVSDTLLIVTDVRFVSEWCAVR
jgi:hypothetical protein